MQYSRVLITGVAGFIASNLAIYLVKKYPNTHFVGIDKLSYCSSLKNLDDIAGATNWKFIQADFTNFDRMDEIFAEFKPDGVLHLGANTHVDNSYGSPLQFTADNVIGTQVLLEVSKKHGKPRWLFVSTDEVFGNSNEQSTENSLVDPSNPYSASKAGAENMCHAYRTSFKIPITIVRGNNVYGPRQFPEKVIPKFILRMNKGLPLQIQGSGEQRRSFIYVDDMCSALETIFLKGQVGQIYNIGSDTEVNLHQLIEYLSKLMNYQPEVKFVEDRPFNDQRYFINSDKLAGLGWIQKVKFDEGLSKTIQWYLTHNNWELESLVSANVYTKEELH